MAIEATDKNIFIKTRRRREAKKRQYELRRLRRLAKARPRHKVYSPPRQSKGGSGSNDQAVSHVFQINAPKDFRLLKNTEECVKFFKKVRDRHKAFTNKVGILEVHIDLSAVMYIDFASTMMLDAICDELSSTPPLCNVWGNAPLRPNCRQYLIDSGFLSNKVDALGRDYGLVGNSDSMKIERGQVKLEDDQILKVVEIEKHICKHVTGSEGRLYRHIEMIKEICGNTVDWSEAKRDQWSYGVKFEEEKVIVVALDLGKGILESISRRFTTFVEDMLARNTHVDILDGAFNRKYGSTSKRKNRNRGLPSIKYAQEKGIIKELTVVTNNVVLDFEHRENSRKFHWNRKRALEATLYSWVIDASCYK